MWRKISFTVTLTAALSMVVNACSTNAKILKMNSTSISGKIVRSDAESVYIKGYGAEIRIPRTEILDISHPGKGLMWVGGSFFAAGTAVIIFSAATDGKTYTSYTYSSNGSTSSSSSKTDNTGFYVSGGIAAGLGLALFLFGYNNYSTSKENLESGGLSLGFPAGMNLGYETITRPAAIPGAATESVHQVKITLRL